MTSIAFATSVSLPKRPSLRHTTCRARPFAMCAKRVLVAVGDGSEEIETSTAVDVLRRAGAEVTLASVGDTTRCTLSRGMVFDADTTVKEVGGGDAFDAVVCPGGMPGASNLRDSEPLKAELTRTRDDGGVIAAICAAPAVVLAAHGMLDGTKATCYPADVFVDTIPNKVDEDVVVDGKVVTGTGPGTALKWALKVVEVLYSDKELANKVGTAMLA